MELKTLQKHLISLDPQNRFLFDGQYDQDIAAETLEKTFLDDLQQVISSPDHIFLENQNGVLVGHKMQWDSNYFGFPVFRIDHLFTSDQAAANALVSELLALLKKDGYKYVFARTKAQDTIFQNALTGSGFNLMLHKVMLRFDFQKNARVSGSKTDDAISIRKFQPKDEELVTNLAADSLMTSRFSLDARINHELTAGLYRNWAKDLINKTPEAIRIAEYQGKPAGMVAFSDANNLYGTGKFSEYPMGFISLVAVDEAFRGKSIGEFLINDALETYKARDYKAVFANTALQNAGSINMFQKAGFKFFSMVSEYRCWL